jgi:phage shock protein PspC (stress-responsive transcriptional regulator)
MNWTFSWGWFFGGIAIAIAGLIMIKFHRQIADNLAGGVQNYDKIKLIGVIAIVGGFICMANLHSLILYFIFHLIMPEQFP